MVQLLLVSLVLEPPPSGRLRNCSFCFHWRQDLLRSSSYFLCFSLHSDLKKYLKTYDLFGGGSFHLQPSYLFSFPPLSPSLLPSTFTLSSFSFFFVLSDRSNICSAWASACLFSGVRFQQRSACAVAQHCRLRHPSVWLSSWGRRSAILPRALSAGRSPLHWVNWVCEADAHYGHSLAAHAG